jgi:D-glycero-alpha-D-manno-heptose-7-phosphate kinase
MVMPCTAGLVTLARVADGTTFTAPSHGYPELISVHREVIARAPTRIDLGGGWTDVPPYCDREGGFVCNIAITLHSVATLSETGDERAPGSGNALIEAALRRSGVKGVSASLENSFPFGAGLGGSSAASAALLAALRTYRGEPIDRADIAEEGRRIEVEELGVAGGRQDHYAATHGGALALTFDGAVTVRRLSFPAVARDTLRASATLIYTGESRISGDTITAVLNAYHAREDRVVRALKRMRELAADMAVALEACDFHALGELVDEHWEYQRSLHPSIPTARIDEIIARARKAGALGAKAMGASGGGCVLILSRPGRRANVDAAVRPLGDILGFDVDYDGVTVLPSTVPAQS